VPFDLSAVALAKAEALGHVERAKKGEHLISIASGLHEGAQKAKFAPITMDIGMLHAIIFTCIYVVNMKLVHSILALKAEPSRLDHVLNDLTEAGYAIVASGVTDEAIEHAATKTFSLMLVETGSLASVVEFLGVLRRANALSSIVVVTQDLDLNSIVHGIRLRIADVFSKYDDDSVIVGRVRSLLPDAPIVVEQLNKRINQLSEEKLALEERLRALGEEFELWQKTVASSATDATVSAMAGAA
jgi:DNA-binding NarL/FixJ family response regulator